MKVLAHRIKTRRKELGWTQQELADKTGIAQSEISRIETEAIHDIETQRLRTLAIGLETSADWLLDIPVCVNS